MSDNGSDRELSEQAQWWADTIDDVHQIEEERTGEAHGDGNSEGPVLADDLVPGWLVRRLHSIDVRLAAILFVAIAIVAFLIAMAFYPEWRSDNSTASDTGVTAPAATVE